MNEVGRGKGGAPPSGAALLSCAVRAGKKREPVGRCGMEGQAGRCSTETCTSCNLLTQKRNCSLHAPLASRASTQGAAAEAPRTHRKRQRTKPGPPPTPTTPSLASGPPAAGQLPAASEQLPPGPSPVPPGAGVAGSCSSNGQRNNGNNGPTTATAAATATATAVAGVATRGGSVEEEEEEVVAAAGVAAPEEQRDEMEALQVWGESVEGSVG